MNGYVRVYVTIKKSSDGSIVDGFNNKLVKEYSVIDGNNRPKFDDAIGYFNYTFDVDVSVKIVSNSGEYPAHIWNDRNFIGAVKQIGIAIEYDS